MLKWCGSACLLIPFAIGCAMPPTDTGNHNSEPPIGVTDTMRNACPILSDESIEAFIMAVAALQDDLPETQEAIDSWVASCANIPPDGNFQGDVEACETCLPVIVEEVYDSTG